MGVPMTDKIVRVTWRVDTGNKDTITLNVSDETADTLTGIDQNGTKRIIDKRAIASIAPARNGQLRFDT